MTQLVSTVWSDLGAKILSFSPSNFPFFFFFSCLLYYLSHSLLLKKKKSSCIHLFSLSEGKSHVFKKCMMFVIWTPTINVRIITQYQGIEKPGIAPLKNVWITVIALVTCVQVIFQFNILISCLVLQTVEGCVPYYAGLGPVDCVISLSVLACRIQIPVWIYWYNVGEETSME